MIKLGIRQKELVMPQTREEKLAYQREWYRKHPEKNKEYEARRDKAKRRKWEKAYRAKYKVHFRELARQARFKRYWKARKAIVDALGGKCIKCGFNDFRALEIHHKLGGGGEERKKYGNGIQLNDYRYYRDMLKHPDDLELLCSNCHSILNWDKKHPEVEQILFEDILVFKK